jgi:hypothetical protein
MQHILRFEAEVNDTVLDPHRVTPDAAGVGDHGVEKRRP